MSVRFLYFLFKWKGVKPRSLSNKICRKSKIFLTLPLTKKKKKRKKTEEREREEQKHNPISKTLLKLLKKLSRVTLVTNYHNLSFLLLTTFDPDENLKNKNWS